METSELKEILDQHRLWLETNGVQGKLANLEGADLRGADLWGANLNGAKLNGAKLYRANLYRASLTGAYLGSADLDSANLTDANLHGAYLRDANLCGANLRGTILTGAYLGGAYLAAANLEGTILPDISWIIPGCLVQWNRINCGFYLEKEAKWESFIQDNLGFFIQNNPIEKTFDMLIEDRIIRNIPDWVKYSGLKQIASESV